MRQRAIKILQFFLLILFISYYAENTLFVHTHQFSWGKVTHSHPYLPSSSHSHSETECSTITLLNDILLLLPLAVAIVSSYRLIDTFYNSFISFVRKAELYLLSERSPPSAF